jgi:hypothetical protein
MTPKYAPCTYVSERRSDHHFGRKVWRRLVLRLPIHRRMTTYNIATDREETRHFSLVLRMFPVGRGLITTQWVSFDPAA